MGFFASQIVPAVAVLAANLLSGRHGSLRWEVVSALFGWAAAITLATWLVIHVFWWHPSVIKDYLLQIFSFCLLTALSRDYEKILRPLFRWNR